MSTAISDVRDREPREEPRGLAEDAGSAEPGQLGPAPDEPVPAPRAVVVRRNAGLAALVGAAASAVAIAYLWRATQTAEVLDWALCALMAGIAAVHLAHLVDARTPLLVADDLGARVRLGHAWRSLPWDAVQEIVVQPRRGLLHDGRLVVVPQVPGQGLEGLDARGRRAAARNQRAHGGALAVPISLTTRASARGGALADALAVLGREQVEVQLRTGTLSDPAHEPAQTAHLAQVPPVETAHPGDVPPDDPAPAERAEAALAEQAGPAGGPRRLSRLGTVVSRAARGRDRDVDVRQHSALLGDQDTRATGAPVDGGPGAGDRQDVGDPHEEDPALPAQRSGRLSAVPLRETRHVLHADVVPDGSVTLLSSGSGSGSSAGHAPDARPAVLSQPAPTVTVPETVTDTGHASSDPVIGPELAAARHRVGLSVDELAERTRIRPHVLESIEVDDFSPCGGDFYARGHLRTLARVLGRDPAPLLQHFDAHHATAPVNARRVFEAELATGMTGSMRSTVGGPSWALLVTVVLTLVLTWGVVRLFATEPTEVLAPPVLDGSAVVAPEPSTATDPAGSSSPAGPSPVEVTLAGAQGGSRVVVRDRSGEVVWAGRVAVGTERTLQVVPPVRVRAVVGGVIAVSLNGADRGLVGETGGPAVRTLHRFAR